MSKELELAIANDPYFGSFFPEERGTILSIQEKLLYLDYQLPKHGKNGKRSFELVDALTEFSDDHLISDCGYYRDYSWWCNPFELKRILEQLTFVYENFSNIHIQDNYLVYDNGGRSLSDKNNDHIVFHNISNKHQREHSKGVRLWTNITGITLHQTGIMMTNRPERFKKLRAHMAILKTRTPTIVQVYPLNTYLWHANKLNSEDIGIEINGCFEGIHGDKKTALKGGYKNEPDVLSTNQIIATRVAISYIIDVVSSHGGEISYIHAHRQSNKKRRSDPGSRVWENVGIWAQEEFSLSDGGDGYFNGGNPIPVEWDKLRKRYKY